MSAEDFLLVNAAPQGDSSTVGSTSDDDFWKLIGIDPSTISKDGPSPTNEEIEKSIGLGEAGSSIWKNVLRAVLGTQGANGTGAGLALGLGALAAALTRQQAPTVKAPEYKAAPVYNRALTAPMFPPQPAPQKSASGQNIYTPMKGMPLFFNPNPFQFDATEAAKRYGPTAAQIAQGQAGYEAGLASLYKPMTVAPFTYAGTSAAPAPTTAPATAPAPSSDNASPVAGATGGSVSDILVGYDGGQVGYNQGGDVYMAAGRYLNGDGDGMSDSIPATINNKQPARLADGEFVVPADVVSDLGNGSSNAGAKKLYDMMKRIRQARHGTKKQPPEVKADKAMPR
jgi:hypothetical protein